MSSNLPKFWSKIKKRWKAQNPPDADGNYICWLCTKPVSAELMTLDHVAPLEQYPEYAKELSNLRPAHRWCNEERARGNHGTLTTLRGRKVLKRHTR